MGTLVHINTPTDTYPNIKKVFLTIQKEGKSIIEQYSIYLPGSIIKRYFNTAKGFITFFKGMILKTDSEGWQHIKEIIPESQDQKNNLVVVGEEGLVSVKKIR
jgi:hypothetical protein